MLRLGAEREIHAIEGMGRKLLPAVLLDVLSAHQEVGWQIRLLSTISTSLCLARESQAQISVRPNAGVSKCP